MDMPPQTDLEVTTIMPPPQPICAGSPAEFQAYIHNTGSTASGSFDIRWNADGQIFNGGHSSIPPGVTDQHGHIWQNLTLGPHALTFIADVNNQIPESNENNNQQTITFTAVDCSNEHSISGRVTDGNDQPIPGVTISAGAGYTATTDGNGDYTITDLSAGTYTLTPINFWPLVRTVNVPLDNPVDFELLDSDNDGLFDIWETDGFDFNGDGNSDVDLPEMGSDPMRKDIFVEIDWMEDDDHSHRPDPQAIQKVIDAFDNAPIPNPGGSPDGINLHVDFGSDSLGQFSEGEPLAHLNILGTMTNEEYDWSQFDIIKNGIPNGVAANFAPARARIFHYVIFAHYIVEPCFTSGISRDIEASDFIVSLGGWVRLSDGREGCDSSNLTAVGHPDHQAGIFMHELGHNLGLRHGGNDDINHKPNYLSVMNYLFATRGLIKSGQEGIFDYSGFFLGVPSIAENNLDENFGLVGGGIPNGYGTRRFNCDLSNPDYIVVENANNSIDWNCDGNVDEGVTADVNGDGLCISPGNNSNLDTSPAGDDIIVGNTISDGPNRTCNSTASGDDEQARPVEDVQPVFLNSFHDWANLKFDVGLIGLGATGQLPTTTPVDELTPEEATKIQPIIINTYNTYLPVVLKNQ
jgi:hypothetical protein